MVEINERAVSRLASKYGIVPKIVEPRILFDRFTFDGINTTSYGTGADSTIFRNGFKYPLQIRYIVAAMLETDDEQATPVLGDERMVQRYGMRIFDHGSYYMSGEYIPLPLWDNRVTAPADIISRSTAVWHFDRPFEFASRDTMEIRVSLQLTTATTRRVSATLEGHGKISKVPYIFTGFVVIANGDGTSEVVIPPGSFRNEGLEPIVMETLTLTCGPDDASTDPTGDIRDLNVAVRQVGYGTNQDWVTGPSVPILFDKAPAVLWGVTTGRCVVHELPANGWIWEPNEGVTVQVQQQVTNPPTPVRAGETVLIGMLGELLVP